MECVECNGLGCEACGDYGTWRLYECPREFVGSELTDAINMAGIADKGAFPVAGGVLDQSAWFIELWRTLGNEQARIEATPRDSNGE